MMNSFESTIINIYGHEGAAWLAVLPKIVHEIAATQGLSALEPLDNLSYHYVLSGFQETQPIVLKLGLDSEGLQQEATALQAFAGFGTVHMKHFSPMVLGKPCGALLLERALPGTSLKSYFPAKDNEAIGIACALMRRLHQSPLPKTGVFPGIQDRLQILDRTWSIPHPYLEKARSLRDQCLANPAKAVLLHGDLHHDNILQSVRSAKREDEDKACRSLSPPKCISTQPDGEGEWVAIDPKAVIGEPAYEVAAFIRNPIPTLLASSHALEIIHARILAFSTLLGLDRQRISDWCFIQAVLAWVWALEDGGDVGSFEGLVQLFDTINRST